MAGNDARALLKPTPDDGPDVRAMDLLAAGVLLACGVGIATLPELRLVGVGLALGGLGGIALALRRGARTEKVEAAQQSPK